MARYGASALQQAIRGLLDNTSYQRLKVNVLVRRDDASDTAGFHQDVVDLYNARQRAAFVKQASIELGHDADVIKSDMGRVLLGLEQKLDEHITRLLEPKPEPVVLSDAEREEALALLRDPRLLDRIVEDFDRAGLVGESDNVLVAYLAAVSRKLDDPLAVVIQSSSAAGKSSLMEAVLAFVPEEERLSFSAMTARSLYYMGAADLSHKVLSIAEERGAESAAYALKLLQSEGKLTIATTSRNKAHGRPVTQQYTVQGPVALMLTTTSISVDDELLNRALVLTVDESPEQTRAIQERQRQAQTLQGLLAREARRAVTKLHQNAQRLLEPLLVVNPHAPAMQASRRARAARALDATSRSASRSSERSRSCTSSSGR